MTDHITARALLEQALEVIVANTTGKDDLEAAIRAELAKPVEPVTPVAWLDDFGSVFPIDALEAENERLRAESEERLQNCAALVAEVERLRKDAERKPMHEGEIQAAWLGQGIEEPMPYTFELGIRSAERFNGIKGTP